MSPVLNFQAYLAFVFKKKRNYLAGGCFWRKIENFSPKTPQMREGERKNEIFSFSLPHPPKQLQKKLNMVRSIVIPKRKILSIKIPESFVGKKVEVIAFAVDEASEVTPSAWSGGVKKFQAIKLKTKGFKFNREEANER